jgi:hypothetical protein
VEQAQAEKTYRVETQAGSKEKLSPEAISTRGRPGVMVLGGIYKCTKSERWHAQCTGEFAVLGFAPAVFGIGCFFGDGVLGFRGARSPVLGNRTRLPVELVFAIPAPPPPCLKRNVAAFGLLDRVVPH